MGTDLNRKGYQKMIDEDIEELENYLPKHSLEKKHIIEVLKWSVVQLYGVEKKAVGVIAFDGDDFRSWVRIHEDIGENFQSTHKKMVYDKTIYYRIVSLNDSCSLTLDSYVETPHAQENPNYEVLIECVRPTIRSKKL